MHSAPGTRCHRNGRRRRFHWSLPASVRVWSAGGATLTGQVCYIPIEAWLEHRAEKWEPRSEEHTYELQSLMLIAYAVFCLKKKPVHKQPHRGRGKQTPRYTYTRSER